MKRFICIVLSGLYGISYFFKNDIINLYIQLTQKINYDDNLARELNGLKNENQHLKDIISGSAYSSVTVDAAYTGLIEAHSSFFDRSNVIYGDIFLDKGYTEGIMKDSLVYVAGLKPVGTIKKVESGFSVLELFTSYKKETEVVLKVDENSSSTLSFSLVGDGAYGFYAKLLKSVDVKMGDILYLKNYPDRKIGQIIETRDTENENVKMVYVESNFNRNDTNLFYISR